jgi:hypothetical protein
MRTLMFVVTAAVVISAHAEPIGDPQRAAAARQQAEQQARIEQARERCLANRGADCDTMEGLREWLLLDRSRAEAVLDRVAPGSSASGGSSTPPSVTVSPSTPQTSPRNVQ